MKTKTKILIIAIINLVVVSVIGLATDFVFYSWIRFTTLYLCGTLLGTFFGAYVMELMIEIKQEVCKNKEINKNG